MEYFLLYIFKTTICLSVFYVFYKILLANDTFFNFNRLVLLIGIGISLVLPAIDLKLNITSLPLPVLELTTSDKFDPIKYPLGQEIVNPILTPNETVEDKAEDKSSIIKSISLVEIVGTIYLVGFLFNSLFLLLSNYKIHSVIKRSKHVEENGFTYYVSEDNIVPFSWKGKYVVLSKNEEDILPIVTHELAHCMRLHWLDILFVELLLLFHWFNPFVWKLKKELKEVHEFQVDQDVLNIGLDAKEYQLLIVKKAVGASSYAIANSFNHNKIKKRITMMLKQKSSNWNKTKVLLFVPVVTTAIILFSCSSNDDNSKDKGLEIIVNSEIAISTDRDSISIRQPKDTIYHRPMLDKDINKIYTYGVTLDPIYKIKKLHEGEDFIAAEGTPIYAIENGVVVEAVASRSSYGNFVKISHGNDVETLYAHNKENLVKEGDKVVKGQEIALVGSTGKSTGNHLHFETRKNGKAFNPSWLMDRDGKVVTINRITEEYLKERQLWEKKSSNENTRQAISTMD